MQSIEKTIKSALPPTLTNIFWLDISGEKPILKAFKNGQWLPVSSEDPEVRELQEKIEKLEEDKVDKIEGKELSSNDFTDELKEKLETLDETAEGIHIKSDWNAPAGNPAEILNRPGIDDVPTLNSNNIVKSGGVATQISQLGQRAIAIPLVSGYYASQTIGAVPSLLASSAYECALIECKEGEVYIITGTGGSNARTWFTCDKDMKIVRHANADTTLSNFSVTIESGEGYVGFNSAASASHKFLLGNIYTVLENKRKDINAKIDLLRSDVSLIPINESGYYANNVIGNRVTKHPSSSYSSAIIPVVEGQIVSIYGYTGSSTARVWAVLDAEKKVTRFSQNTGTNAEDVKIAGGEFYLCVNFVPSLVTPSVSLKNTAEQITALSRVINNKDARFNSIITNIGTYWTTAGKTTSSSYWSSSDLIPLTYFNNGIRILRGSLYAGGGIHSVFFFDINGDFISSLERSLPQYGVIPSSDIPASAVYVAFNKPSLTDTLLLLDGYLKTTIPSLDMQYNKIITIVDDDTILEAHVSKMMQVCQDNDIVCTFATLTQQFDAASQWLEAKIREGEREGFQFTLHSYDQNSGFQSPYDIPACIDSLIHGLQDMKEHSVLDYNQWVTPNGSNGPALQKFIKQFGLDCLVSIGQSDYVHNDGQTSRFNIPRISFNSDDLTGATMAEIKSLIDSAALENGWVILGTHIYNGWTDELLATRFKEVVDYAKDAGFTFVTLGEGYRQREQMFKYYETFWAK